MEIDTMAIDSTFWVAISFIIFFGGLVYLKVPQKINIILEKLISDIKKEIDESEKLRTEAKLLLEEAQKKLDTAQSVRNEILEDKLISTRLKEDCAINEMIAPSNSRTLVLIFLATYSMISSFMVTPSLNSLFFRIEILVSKSGTCNSADKPHLNRDNNLCSMSCMSTGALSEVIITCFPF